MGDNEAARKTVLELAAAIGFDHVDAGPLKNARSLEALAPLNIQLSWLLGYGPNVGFKFVYQREHAPAEKERSKAHHADQLGN